MSYNYKKKITNFNKKKKIFKSRIINFIIFIIIMIIIIMINTYYLQIKNFNKYSFLARKNFTKFVTITPLRGYIYDRNKNLVSYNIKKYDLYINTLNIQNINNTIKKIKKIFFISKIKLNKIKNKTKKKKIFCFIKNANKKDINKYLINKNILPEIFIKKNTLRYYPYKKIISSILGYTINTEKVGEKNKIKFINKGNYIGKSGIEEYYENILHGKEGFYKIIVNSKNKIIDIYKFYKPINGKNIFLTIDIKLQKYIYNLINKEKISIIVSNIKNGEILSLITNPTYNNNIFNKKISKLKFKKIINNKNNFFINKVIQGIYPPASTIKPYISIGALNDKIIKKNSTIFDKGWWKIPNTNNKFYDWKKWGHGYLNIINSIEESSDTFYYKIAYNMGIDKIYYWMKYFGYGEKTNIDLPGEITGILPNKIWKKNKYNKMWYTGDTISVGIGQGYWSATPIQMHKALLIFVNNGIYVRPHILKKIDHNSILIKRKIINKLNKINIKYWNIIKKGMYGVACKKNGTAYKNFLGIKYKLAVKSGTAQIFSLNKNRNYNKITKINSKLKDHTLMNAYLPYKNPIFAITIVLENGGEKYKIGDLMRKITDYLIIQNKLN